MEEELFIEKTSIVNGVSRKLAPLFTKLQRETVRKALRSYESKPQKPTKQVQEALFSYKNHQNRGFRCSSNPFSDSLSRQFVTKQGVHKR